MPTVNVTDEANSRIELIQEHSRWNPSKREVVGKALKQLEDKEVPEHEQLETQTEDER